MAKRDSVYSNLCPEAQAFIKNLYDLLNKQKVLTSLDNDAMNLIGGTYHNYIQATKILAKDGMLITSPRGELKAHPAVKIQLDSQIQLDKLMDKFGLNPKSRREIAKPLEKAKDKSDIAKFLEKSQKKVNATLQNN
jgi:P27 family predicted phage terminase small subunit